MITYSSSEIVLIAFPLTNSSGVKQRPALVLLDGGDQDIVVARITSQPARTSSDIVLAMTIK